MPRPKQPVIAEKVPQPETVETVHAIEAIAEEKQPVIAEKVKSGKMFGNKDTDKKHEFDATWAKGVVVRQSDWKNVGEGAEDYVEIPSTVKLAVYEPAVYEWMLKNKGFGSTKVKVIHDPR